jgi:predicted HTH domain antitoxin
MADVEGTNIDLAETNQKLDQIIKALNNDPKNMIKDIAIRLYAKSDFDHTSKSASQLADAAIERAKILATKLC